MIDPTYLMAKYVKQGISPLCMDMFFVKEVISIIQGCKCGAIVETGSGHGWSSNYIKDLFPELKVWSCDLNPQLIDDARKLNPLVYYDVADGATYIKKLYNDKRITNKTPFFYLDSRPYEGNGDIPLAQELEVIASSGETSVIMVHDYKIDDAPDFGYTIFKDVIIDFKLVNNVIKKFVKEYVFFYPNCTYYHFDLRGRCYILINPTLGMYDAMKRNTLLTRIDINCIQYSL